MIAKQNTGFIKDAIYLSYTSLNDFLRCPRSYYLKNIYRNPETGYKLQIASPYITLGATVHDVLEWYIRQYSQPTLDETLKQFRNFWTKFRQKKGGFTSIEQEADFGKRGLKMVENFVQHVEVLEPSVPPVKFPKYVLPGDVILIGNFDFVGKKPDGTLHIVDFKTGAKDEESPIQLYIYAILAEANLQKPVSSASYWYLDRDDEPRDVVLDPLDATLKWLEEQAVKVKKAIQEDNWLCIKGDSLCFECQKYQAVIDGKGELMFSDVAFKKDVYFLGFS